VAACLSRARFRRAAFCRDSRSAASLSTSKPRRSSNDSWPMSGVCAWLAKARAMPERRSWWSLSTVGWLSMASLVQW